MKLILGDCTQLLATIPPASVDAVITDPPYPEISRDYGRMTEAAWWDMMMVVCAETRRILKPTGSAVFILQPNSRKVGSMRGWLWEFMAWVCREWNMVQDVWWWNYTITPTVISIQGQLTRQSIKCCVWIGPPDCYREQSRVLWTESQWNIARRKAEAARGINQRDTGPSGHGWSNRGREAAEKRGGTTPFNLLPIQPDGFRKSSRKESHGATTPLELAKWWTRYIVPPGGVVCDPFMGSGTMGLAALAYGCDFIGIEKEDRPGYYPTASARLTEAGQQLCLVLDNSM